MRARGTRPPLCLAKPLPHPCPAPRLLEQRFDSSGESVIDSLLSHLFAQVPMRFRVILAVLVVSSSVVAGVPAALTANQDVNSLQQLLSRVEKVEANLIAVDDKVEATPEAVDAADLDAVDDDDDADPDDADPDMDLVLQAQSATPPDGEVHEQFLRGKRGPRGPRGKKGSRGPMGPQGERGPAGPDTRATRATRATVAILVLGTTR